MVEVLPLALHLLMRLGEHCHRLAAAVAALLRRDTRRCAVFSAALGFAIPARIEDASSIGEGSERLYAEVNTSLLSSGGNGCIGTSAQEKQTYQPSASRRS